MPGGTGYSEAHGNLMTQVCAGRFRSACWVACLYCEEVNGGEGGIRTPDTLTSMPDFESGAFNRALPPLRRVALHASGPIQLPDLCFRTSAYPAVETLRGSVTS